MSRVVQLISHNQHLFALTDTGEIFQLRKRRVKCRVEEYWNKVANPSVETDVPPRFSLPEEYDPPLAQSPPLPPLERGMFTGCGSYEAAKQSESRLFRRPTSIGSDGNYIPTTGD